MVHVPGTKYFRNFWVVFLVLFLLEASEEFALSACRRVKIQNTQKILLLAIIMKSGLSLLIKYLNRLLKFAYSSYNCK